MFDQTSHALCLSPSHTHEEKTKRRNFSRNFWVQFRQNAKMRQGLLKVAKHHVLHPIKQILEGNISWRLTKTSAFRGEHPFSMGSPGSSHVSNGPYHPPSQNATPSPKRVALPHSGPGALQDPCFLARPAADQQQVTFQTQCAGAPAAAVPEAASAKTRWALSAPPP